MSYYIKVSKIDYYSWKIATIFVLSLLIASFWFYVPPVREEINDGYWHMGYQECLNDKVNLTSDELMNLNQYRVCKLENKRMGCG